MKTLQLKKNWIAALFSAFKSLPPKEFETVDEMEKLFNNILPVMEEEMGEYIKWQDKIKKAQKEFTLGRSKEAETLVLVKSYGREIEKLDLVNESIEVELQFEDADFNTLFDLFAKYGKNIFVRTPDFLATRKALDATNSQSKKKEKK